MGYPIDNTNLVNLGQSNCATGFTPSCTYGLSGTNVTVTDASTFKAGDDLDIIHVRITDNDGKYVTGKIETAAGNVVISVSTLNRLDGMAVTAQVVTEDGLTGDISVYDLGRTAPASGTMRYANVPAC